MENKAVVRDMSGIRRAGIEALTEKLGPVGMTEFMRQFDSGHGDYTSERHEWLDKMDFEDIYNQIEAKRNHTS